MPLAHDARQRGGETSNLRDAFSRTPFRQRGVATAASFALAQEWLRNHDYHGYLLASGRLSASSERMDPCATPFDFVLRQASGKAPNFVEQSGLGGRVDEFMVCHHDAAFDARWDDGTRAGALAGPDRRVGGLPGHVVLTTRDTRWVRSNVGALALGGGEEERVEAVRFLERMREAAMTYARSRGWTRLGLYFRFFGCEPEGEEEYGIIRLHVVNLARAGPWLRRTAKVNLPIDDVIEALGGARTSRRGAVLIVPENAVESASPVDRLTPIGVQAQDDVDSDADESEDEIQIAIKRVIAAASAPPVDSTVEIPEQMKQIYENAASPTNVRTAVREVQKGTLGDDGGSDAFLNDLRWLREYKTLSSPAHVQIALKEVSQ